MNKTERELNREEATTKKQSGRNDLFDQNSFNLKFQIIAHIVYAVLERRKKKDRTCNAIR